jgi:hypothetical protein
MAGKYFIVASFFLALGLASLQSIVISTLEYISLKWIAILFIFVLISFSGKEALVAFNKISNYYTAAYGYIDSVPVIAKDIAFDSIKSSKLKSKILSNNLFLDSGLSFYRQINLLHGVNIFHKGKFISNISSAPEMNYFHIVKDAPSIQLDVVARLGRFLPHDTDTVYVYEQFHNSKIQHILNAEGFMESKEFFLKAQQIARKYSRLP